MNEKQAIESKITDTDIDKFKELFHSIGIDIKINTDDKKYDIIILDENTSDKFVGYSGLFTENKFDKKGKFIEQCFWG